MSLPAIVPAAAAFLLLGTLLALEAARFDGRRRALRAVAWALAVGALWSLAVRPTWTREAGDEALLITPGATAGEIRAARGAAGRDAPVLAIGVAAPPGATAVPDLGYVTRHLPGVRRLRVAGDGLSAWAWDRWPGRVTGPAAALDRAPASAPPGASRVEWSREIALGETWVVRGRLDGDAPAASRLQLIGPEGVADTAEPPPGPGGEFALRATPPREGRRLYRLALVTASGEAVVEETLDVVVRRPDPVAVLWLEGAPGFETRDFKHWLTRRGGALVVRSTLTRGKNRVERYNHPPVDVERLSEGLLARFDLLVVDRRTLAALTRGEGAALGRAVAGGLGVLVLGAGPADRAAGDAGLAFLTDWPTRPLAGLERFAARPRFEGGRAAGALDIAPLEIAADGGVLPLLADDAGVVLAARRRVGSGSAGLSLLEDSFRWIREGEPADHAAYWSRMIGGLARPRRDPRWLPAGGPVLVDDPLTLRLETADPRPACVVRDAGGAPLELAPRQDPLEPRRWEVTLRPRRDGWHSVETAGGTTAFYALPREAWRAWQLAQRRSATARRSLAPPPDPGPAAVQSVVRRAVPLWPAYLVLLGCLAGLWFDERR